MLHIAVVEDDKIDAERIVSFLNRFASQSSRGGSYFKITCFENVINFLTDYAPVYDLIFMDIQMPFMNGMDAAAKLREKDLAVPLVFITNMANFAVRGYSVDALDFIIKPVNYLRFCTMMQKTMRVIDAKSAKIVLKNGEEVKKVPLDDICYIEVRDHRLIYHTASADIEIWGTLKEQEEKLPKDSFMRCNNCYLVNLKYVEEVENNKVKIRGMTIPVSRAKKHAFVQKLLEYYGKNI